MRYRQTKLTVLFLVAGGGLLCPILLGAVAETSGESQATRTNQKTSTKAASPSEPAARYSRFSHQIPKHKQACDSCHKFPSANWKDVRKGDEAFPDVTDYPQHASCLQCHRQQFFSGAVPAICSVCHTEPSPRNSSRHPFSNPREAVDATNKGQTAFSEYKVFFPHEKHEGLFGQSSPPPERHRVALVVAAFNSTSERQDPSGKNESCAKCHQPYQPQGDSAEEFVTKPPSGLPETAFWLKKDTFKTSPQSHALCFTCHTQEGGIPPASGDCATCHKLIPPELGAARRAAHGDFDPKLAAAMGITARSTLDKWRKREAVRFRHEWVTHVDLACTDCHKVVAIDTLAEKGPTVPVLSCGGAGSGCHITATNEEGGALNMEVSEKKSNPTFECTKCHAILGKQQVPESHLKALAGVKSVQ